MSKQHKDCPIQLVLLKDCTAIERSPKSMHEMKSYVKLELENIVVASAVIAPEVVAGKVRISAKIHRGTVFISRILNRQSIGSIFVHFIRGT